ncbi:MAG: hypothetical protein MJY68_00255 [Bacteroidaceae bacterium]|nr:hypothetical protein [Bacteroidaceae bacterium]MCQ2067525.1 hypothetical protein [Bacteroidaceae bacterium]
MEPVIKSIRHTKQMKLWHRVIMKQGAMFHRAGPWNSWQFRGASRTIPVRSCQ